MLTNIKLSFGSSEFGLKKRISNYYYEKSFRKLKKREDIVLQRIVINRSNQRYEILKKNKQDRPSFFLPNSLLKYFSLAYKNHRKMNHYYLFHQKMSFTSKKIIFFLTVFTLAENSKLELFFKNKNLYRQEYSKDEMFSKYSRTLKTKKNMNLAIPFFIADHLNNLVKKTSKNNAKKLNDKLPGISKLFFFRRKKNFYCSLNSGSLEIINEYDPCKNFSYFSTVQSHNVLKKKFTIFNSSHKFKTIRLKSHLKLDHNFMRIFSFPNKREEVRDNLKLQKIKPLNIYQPDIIGLEENKWKFVIKNLNGIPTMKNCRYLKEFSQINSIYPLFEQNLFIFNKIIKIRNVLNPNFKHFQLIYNYPTKPFYGDFLKNREKSFFLVLKNYNLFFSKPIVTFFFGINQNIFFDDFKLDLSKKDLNISIFFRNYRSKKTVELYYKSVFIRHLVSKTIEKGTCGYSFGVKISLYVIFYYIYLLYFNRSERLKLFTWPCFYKKKIFRTKIKVKKTT